MRTARSQPRATDVHKLAEKVRRVAADGGFTSCMNDTKWRELCHAFYAWPTKAKFRIRSLLAAPGYVHDWDGEWWYHPYPYVDIHWLEIRLAPESVSEALQICKRVGAAVEVAGEGLKVWGWTGPADRPQFA